DPRPCALAFALFLQQGQRTPRESAKMVFAVVRAGVSRVDQVTHNTVRVIAGLAARPMQRLPRVVLLVRFVAVCGHLEQRGREVTQQPSEHWCTLPDRVVLRDEEAAWRG